MHVAEAVECLEALLPALQKMKVSPLKIITGSGKKVKVGQQCEVLMTVVGHHTLGPQQGKSRLFPAVQSYCDELGLRTSVIKDDNGYAGGLCVYL